jgi:hypothetical protein
VGRVDWLPNARTDLAEIRNRNIIIALVQVGEQELRQPPQPDADPDEDNAAPPWMWRRGITRRQRQQEASGELPEDEGNQPWNYFLIYRARRPAEVVRAFGRPGFVVGHVWSVQQLAYYLPTSGLQLTFRS